LDDIGADSTMTSPLLCDTAYLSDSRVELLCDLFLPVVQSQAVEEHDTLTTRLFRYRYSTIQHRGPTDLDPEADEAEYDVIGDVKTLVLAYQLLKLLRQTNVLKNSQQRTG